MQNSMEYRKWIRWALMITWGLLFMGCAHHKPLPREGYQWMYQPVAGDSSDDAVRFAPTFVVYGHDRDYNRIGRPRAVTDDDGDPEIFVDTRQPTLYFARRTFRTSHDAYTNLIYRVHFPGTPFSLVPFNLTAGKNVGLLVVVTLDSAHRPVLVTTVHTCGCFKAIVATDLLPASALPDRWPAGGHEVFSEFMPTRLDYRGLREPRLLVHLRPEVHRVMALEVHEARVVTASPRFRAVPMAMAPMDDLRRIALDGNFTSLYYDHGAMQGHVKGALKPLETLFMSLISLDLFVGMDKAYADPAAAGNHFYTSLKPWNREESDMQDFAGFLKFWGWRL